MITLEKTPLLLRILLPVLWYGFIFFLTELPYAAGSNTRDTISEIIEKNQPGLDTFTIANRINFAFRTSAHFFMFGILANLVYFSLKPDFNFNKRTYWLVVIVIIGILGGLDEFHQSFKPGRQPRIEDVLIDCSGAVALLFSALWLKCRYLSKYLN